MENTDCNGDWEAKCLDLLDEAANDAALRLSVNKLSETKSISYNLSSRLLALLSKDEVGSDRYNTAVAILKCAVEQCDVEDMVVDLIQISSENLTFKQFQLLLDLYLNLFKRECKRKEIHVEWCLSYLRQGYLNNLTEETESFNELLFNFFENLFPLFSPLSANFKSEVSKTILVTISKAPDQQLAIAVKLLLTISMDPFSLLPLVTEFEDISFHKNSLYLIGLANLFFVVLSNDEFSYPLVYSHHYIFLNLIPIMCELIERDNYSNVCKGLVLLEKFTPLLFNSLTLEKLSSNVGCLLEKLNDTMIYHDDRALRIRVFKCFEATFNCYDNKAQYHLLLNFRARVSHSGTLSFIISKIKQNFDLSRQNPSDLRYFNGKRLLDMLKAYGFLTNGVNTDIVNDAEQILASLNIFWYLIKVAENDIFIASNFIPCLKLNYLDPLKSLILQGLENCTKELNKVSDDKLPAEFDVTVNNLPLPSVSLEEQKRSVLCARNAIELIQNSFLRLVDILNEKFE